MKNPKEITLVRGEGPTEECDQPVMVGSYAEASAVLARWARTAPASGGYDKCDFSVSWEDGETYEGRYDLQNTGFNDSGETINGQMHSFLGFLAGTVRPAWVDDAKWATIRKDKEADGSAASAREFLSKYDF